MDWMLIIGTATFASTSLVYIWYLNKSLEMLRDRVSDLSNASDKTVRHLQILEDSYGEMNSRVWSLTSRLNILRPEIDTAFIAQEIEYTKQDMEHFTKCVHDSKIKLKNLAAKLKSVKA